MEMNANRNIRETEQLTSAFCFGILQQSEVNHIGVVGGIEIESVVDATVFSIPRIGEEGEHEKNESETDYCNGPVFLGPFTPP